MFKELKISFTDSEANKFFTRYALGTKTWLNLHDFLRIWVPNSANDTDGGLKRNNATSKSYNCLPGMGKFPQESKVSTPNAMKTQKYTFKSFDFEKIMKVKKCTRLCDFMANRTIKLVKVTNLSFLQILAKL